MPKMSWEREYLKKDHDLILKLFDHRCIVCGRRTNEIHEIIPISHGKKYLAIKNRVPVCRKHHIEAHNSTKRSIPELQELRKRYIWSVMYRKVINKYPKFISSQVTMVHSKVETLDVWDLK